MKQDDAERHVIFAFSVLLLFFAGFTLFVVSIVRASPVPDSAASSATFHTKCGICHGQDGGGSAVGKTMNIPDLRLRKRKHYSVLQNLGRKGVSNQ